MFVIVGRKIGRARRRGGSDQGDHREAIDICTAKGCGS
jgi:hypothetical protein